MAKRRSIPKTGTVGVDRIEWLDERGMIHAARATSPAAVEDVAPGRLARILPRFKGQTNYHGSYWHSQTGRFVEHESMTEFTGLMVLDYLYETRAISAQPCLITFANGRHHTPDFLVLLTSGRRRLIDVHLSSSTTAAEAELFELTRDMCTRVGWDYDLMDEVDQVYRWNLEWLNRYHHPRYRGEASFDAKILGFVARGTQFGALRAWLRTDRPGEHLPALYNLMWRRKVFFNMHAPLTDTTQLFTAHRPDD